MVSTSVWVLVPGRKPGGRITCSLAWVVLFGALFVLVCRDGDDVDAEDIDVNDELVMSGEGMWYRGLRGEGS